jgi:hypothetical protein
MRRLLRAMNRVRLAWTSLRDSEKQLLLLGRQSAQIAKMRGPLRSLHEAEFRVFSQFGDDGIIQWLIGNLEIPNRTFVEFGVEDYRESNTRFLMMNDNWSGMVMDGSAKSVARIVDSEYYWRFDLLAKCAFIDTDNINELLASSGFHPELGILHIDLDGNDYWIWKAVNVVSPVVLILEYNSALGIEKALTVPYKPDFFRTKAHFSNLYWGASLRALYDLSVTKGYAFVGCNSAGNNAYFVRRDKLNDRVQEVPLAEGYVVSKYRESRDKHGQLTYLAGSERMAQLKGMPIFNVTSGQVETL